MRSDYGSTSRSLSLLACQLFVTALTLPATGQAQSLNLHLVPRINPSKSSPTTVSSGSRKMKFYRSGNAKASRGGINVEAEVIRGWQQKSEGGADLYRSDAFGGVKIHSSTDSIVGETAVYDIEKAILRVDGRKVVFLKVGMILISATQQMEYWERQKMAVARGRAVAAHQGKTVRADILKALMREKKRKTENQRST